MRIGLITGEYPPMQGGVADFTRELGRALLALGHEIHVLTSRSGGGVATDGLKVSASVSNWNRASLRTVQQWVAQNELDVINLQYQTAAYDMAPLIHLLPRLTGDTPFVATFHDLRVPYLFPKAGPIRDWWVLRLARDASAAIVTNVEDERRLRLAGVVSHTARIPIGSNISGKLPGSYDRSAWRKKLGVGPEECLIAYFGFLNSSKGVDVLLKAMAAAVSTGLPLKLVIIGGRTGASDPTNAAYAREIDALAEVLGLGERVTWTGFVESGDVSAFLTCADLCALPFVDGVSFRRGSYMAALAHGCPTVTTIPGQPIPELQERENVMLVPPGDVEALAAALVELASDEALRQRLGQGASALHAQFTWDRIAAQTASLFAGLLK